MRAPYTAAARGSANAQIASIEEFAPLQLVTNFAALVANYDEGFMVIFEPYDEREPDIADPKLQLCCLDASIAMKPVFQRFNTVVITSGTLSPLDMYPKLLECRPAVVGCRWRCLAVVMSGWVSPGVALIAGVRLFCVRPAVTAVCVSARAGRWRACQ